MPLQQPLDRLSRVSNSGPGPQHRRDSPRVVEAWQQESPEAFPEPAHLARGHRPGAQVFTGTQSFRQKIGTSSGLGLHSLDQPNPFDVRRILRRSRPSSRSTPCQGRRKISGIDSVSVPVHLRPDVLVRNSEAGREPEAVRRAAAENDPEVQPPVQDSERHDQPLHARNQGWRFPLLDRQDHDVADSEPRREDGGAQDGVQKIQRRV